MRLEAHGLLKCLHRMDMAEMAPQDIGLTRVLEYGIWMIWDSILNMKQIHHTMLTYSMKHLRSGNNDMLRVLWASALT